MSDDNSFRWDVMVVREFEGRNGAQKFWTKVGVAFAGKNDAISIQLDALPVDGRLVLVVPKTEEEWEELRRNRGGDGGGGDRGGRNRGRGGQQRGGGRSGGGGSGQRRGGAPRRMSESTPSYPGPRGGGGGGGSGGSGFVDDPPPGRFADDEPGPEPDSQGYGGGGDDEIPF